MIEALHSDVNVMQTAAEGFSKSMLEFVRYIAIDDKQRVASILFPAS
jgi:hypothetical protein